MSAYTQAFLRGCATWVAIPRERWPEEWKDLPYCDPVVPLVLALYGHPDAGGFWEQRCEEQVKLEGWETIPNWPGLFWHPVHKALLIVYVDDSKWQRRQRSQTSCGKAFVRDSISTNRALRIGFWVATDARTTPSSST